MYWNKEQNYALILLVIVTIGIVGYFIYVEYRDLRPGDKTSVSNTVTWKTYRDTKNGFEVKYPSTWFIYPGSTANPNYLGLQSTSADKNLHGVGLPIKGEMWVKIYKTICENQTPEFKPLEIGSEGTYILEKRVCKGNFLITLGLWDSDLQKEAHKDILETIANSFRAVPAETTGWKTYRSEKYGFEVKYPPTFTAKEDKIGAYVSFIPFGKEEFTLSISRVWLRTDSTLEEFVHNDTGYNETKADKLYYPDDDLVTINGITVYRYRKILGRHNDWHFFFLKDNTHGTDTSYINFHVEYGNNPYVSEIDQILSTFKFTQ